MSAFLVQDKSINRVVTFLGDQHREFRWAVSGIEAAIECYIHQDDFSTKLAVSMHILNCDALNSRYPSDAQSLIDAFDGFRFEQAGRVQVLKSLSCWLYQCSEGDVPNRPLYKAMRQFQASLALAVIADLPEYDQAEWA